MNLFAAYAPHAPCLIDEGATFAVEEVTSLARSSAANVSTAGAAFIAHAEVAVVALALGLLERGVPFAPLHPRWGEAEIAAGLTTLGRSSVIDPHEPGPSDLQEASQEAPLSAVREGLVLMTSGTTSAPKGARLSRAALLASARASLGNLGALPHDRWLCAMPIAHVGGLSIFVRAVTSGVPVVIHRAFDPERVLWAIENQGVTLLSVVPTMLHQLLAIDRGQLSKLRAMLVGGASAPVALLEACDARRIPALTTYGMTETASQVVTQPLGVPWRRAAGLIGRALDGVAVRTDDAGRVLVRGPMLFDGYLGEEARPREAWFATGDRGALDAEGNVWIDGRIDDVIISGGENVAPNEVEASLRAHPSVRDALVFGVPDARWGHAVACALVLEAGAGLARTVREATVGLAPWKRPRRAVQVDAVPMTALGKPSRAIAARDLASRLEAVETER